MASSSIRPSALKRPTGSDGMPRAATAAASSGYLIWSTAVEQPFFFWSPNRDVGLGKRAKRAWPRRGWARRAADRRAASCASKHGSPSPRPSRACRRSCTPRSPLPGNHGCRAWLRSGSCRSPAARVSWPASPGKKNLLYETVQQSIV